MYMHVARAEKTIGEAKGLVQKYNHTLVADKGVWGECVGRCRAKVKGNRWVWDIIVVVVFGSLALLVMHDSIRLRYRINTLSKRL